jgi:hypothetical protein
MMANAKPATVVAREEFMDDRQPAVSTFCHTHHNYDHHDKQSDADYVTRDAAHATTATRHPSLKTEVEAALDDSGASELVSEGNEWEYDGSKRRHFCRYRNNNAKELLRLICLTRCHESLTPPVRKMKLRRQLMLRRHHGRRALEFMTKKTMIAQTTN